MQIAAATAWEGHNTQGLKLFAELSAGDRRV